MILLAVEGPDGVGKSTMARELATRLRALYTHEPTDGKWGKRARRLVREGRNSEALHYFLADRTEHALTKVFPALMRGRKVIIDRYYMSTLVYQCKPGAPLREWAQAVGDFCALHPPAVLPHLTLLLMADEDLLEERCTDRDGKKDVALQPWVIERYQFFLSERSVRVIHVDGLDPDEVVQAAMDTVLGSFSGYLVGEF